MSGRGTETAPDAAATATRHIFVSFASEDVELARRAVQRLERSGFRCWISERDIEPAASYPTAITGAVVDSGALLLLLTESANGSPHVLREIELAFNARTPILPVRVSGVLPSSDLEYFLSTTQWFDAGSTFDDADFERVESRLQELLQPARGGGGRRAGGRRVWPMVAGTAALAVAAAAAIFFWSSGGAGPDPTDAARALLEDTTIAVPPAPENETSAAVTVKVNPRDGQTYVWVPPGRFVMGCSAGDPACQDDERPAHQVNITAGFWLGRTEVTRGQYERAPAEVSAPRPLADEDHPITGIAWAAAKAYCGSVGGRLPSEAQWEYAARAGTPTRYYGSLPAIAWFADNADGEVHRVGTKAPNAYGLHDMLGNASEWVRDRYYNAYDDSADLTAVEEPLAGNASGVARGGSWVSEAAGVRVSRRLEMPPDAEEPHIGFRCAMDRL